MAAARPWVTGRGPWNPAGWLRGRISSLIAWTPRQDRLPIASDGRGASLAGTAARAIDDEADDSADGAPSGRVRCAVNRVKHLGLVDLTALRTFTRSELVEFQAELHARGGIRTTAERVIDRMITRRQTQQEPRRAFVARREVTGCTRQSAAGVPTWVILLMFAVVEVVAVVVWGFAT